MTKAGVKLDILMNATTRRDEEKRIVGVIGIGQDVGFRGKGEMIVHALRAANLSPFAPRLPPPPPPPTPRLPLLRCRRKSTKHW